MSARSLPRSATHVPVTNQFYGVDNETDQLGSGIGVLNSSILVKIRDFTIPLNQDVNLGAFLFDGTVTGRVFVSGSMNKFYAGWLITGDSSAGGPLGGGTPIFTDNFHVNGDIQHILSLASIGTDGTQTSTRGRPLFFTGTEIDVGGKIGDILTDDEMAAHVVANDGINVPNIKDANPLSPIPQTEDQEYVAASLARNNTDIAVRNAWASGELVWNKSSVAPFSNTNFNNAQYLGSVRNSVTGQPDVIHLQGQLWLRSGTSGPDSVDFFAVSLLAGQSITVLLSAFGAANVGIYDPDGRLISSDFSTTTGSVLGANGRPITFTASMAGTYRIAVSNNSGFTTGSGIRQQPYTTPPTRSTSPTSAISPSVAWWRAPNVLLNNRRYSFSSGIEAVTVGDIGAVVAGQDQHSVQRQRSGRRCARRWSARATTTGAGTTANHNIMAAPDFWI